MNIGNASKASGLSARMIRYYESAGLLPRAPRRPSNYRDYSESDVHRLMFVRRARDLGFEIDLIRNLLGLWSDRRRSNEAVRKIATRHVAVLEAQATKLQDLIKTLRELVGACQRGGRPDCPIMTELAGSTYAPQDAMTAPGEVPAGKLRGSSREASAH